MSFFSFSHKSLYRCVAFVSLDNNPLLISWNHVKWPFNIIANHQWARSNTSIPLLYSTIHDRFSVWRNSTQKPENFHSLQSILLLASALSSYFNLFNFYPSSKPQNLHQPVSTVTTMFQILKIITIHRIRKKLIRGQQKSPSLQIETLSSLKPLLYRVSLMTVEPLCCVRNWSELAPTSKTVTSGGQTCTFLGFFFVTASVFFSWVWVLHDPLHSPQPSLIPF